MLSKLSGEQIIDALKEYVNKNPQDTEIYSLLGTIMRETGLSLKAAQIHRNILAKPSLKKKTKAKIMTELAKDLYALGNMEEAERLVKETLKLETKNRQALSIQFDIHRDKGEIDKAVGIVEKTDYLESRNLSSLYSEYAGWLLDRGEIGKARKALKKAFNLCQDNIDALILSGDLELKAQKFKDAADYYFKAIDTNSTYTPSILKKIENAFYLSKSYDNLSARLREELEEKNDNADLHCELGKFLKKRILNDDAKDEFKKALEFNPTHLKARQELIEIYLDEKNLNAIKEELVELFSEIKKNMSYYCTRCSNRERAPRWKCPICGSFDSYEKMIFLF